MRLFTVTGAFALGLTMAGCAVQQQATSFTPLPAAMSATPADSQPLSLQKQVDISLGTGYSRTLKQGSRWLAVGSVNEGQVFRPYQDVFTLEGSHIHEAYLVVSNNRLVGFYLPAEKTFSPLKPDLALSFNQ